MESLQDRLMIAAALAYIEARELDKSDPPAQVEDCVRFLRQHMESELPGADDVRVNVKLSITDVYSIIRAIQDASWYRGQYENTFQAQNSWIAAWNGAKSIMKEKSNGASWNERSRKAIRSLNLSREKKGSKHDYEKMKRRYEDLLHGYFDCLLNEHVSPVDKVSAIESIKDEFRFPSIGACRQALHRAGVRDLPRV
jgi:hypothetical protein